MDCSTPGFPVHHQLLDLTQAHVHWVGDAIQPAHPLSFPSHPTFNLSQLKVFSNESVLPIRWLKYWSFSFSVSPSNEYSGVITLGWTGWIYLLSKGPLTGASATEPMCCNCWSLQAPEPVLCNKRSHSNEKPTHKPDHCNETEAHTAMKTSTEKSK